MITLLGGIAIVAATALIVIGGATAIFFIPAFVLLMIWFARKGDFDFTMTFLIISLVILVVGCVIILLE